MELFTDVKHQGHKRVEESLPPLFIYTSDFTSHTDICTTSGFRAGMAVGTTCNRVTAEKQNCTLQQPSLSSLTAIKL